MSRLLFLLATHVFWQACSVTNSFNALDKSKCTYMHIIKLKLHLQVSLHLFCFLYDFISGFFDYDDRQQWSTFSSVKELSWYCKRSCLDGKQSVCGPVVKTHVTHKGKEHGLQCFFSLLHAKLATVMSFYRS